MLFRVLVATEYYFSYYLQDTGTENSNFQENWQTEATVNQAGQQIRAGKGVKFGVVSKCFRIQESSPVIKDVKLISNDQTKEEAVNEFEIFGKSVGIQLKSLFEEDAVVAQEEIQSILTSYRLKKIRHTNEISCIAHTTSSIYERSQPQQSHNDDITQYLPKDQIYCH